MLGPTPETFAELPLFYHQLGGFATCVQLLAQGRAEKISKGRPFSAHTPARHLPANQQKVYTEGRSQ